MTTPMITEAQYRKIRSAMMLKGVTNIGIAEREHVTDNYVTYVLTGRRKGYRIRRAIAEECGVAYEALWPDEEEPEEPKLPEAA